MNNINILTNIILILILIISTVGPTSALGRWCKSGHFRPASAPYGPRDPYISYEEASSDPSSSSLSISSSSSSIADIYISTSMETFEHRKYKVRGDDGNN